jgi:hypothetical protein
MLYDILTCRSPSFMSDQSSSGLDLLRREDQYREMTDFENEETVSRSIYV